MTLDNSDLLPSWKRLADIVIGLFLLLIAMIPMLALAIAIWGQSGGPVLIRQRRIGLHAAEFRMWKFRTLPVDTPQMAKAELIEIGLRSGRLGLFLRRYSLDELPQLFNVIVGDMSLIGPRPALYTQTDLVQLREKAGVFRVRPGLTGLAQVNGREDLTLENKVALDAAYVRRLSPIEDLRIVLRTAGAVLRTRGSY